MLQIISWSNGVNMSDKTIKIRPLISAIIIALLVVIDQISKVIAYNTLAVNGNASTIKNAVLVA